MENLRAEHRALEPLLDALEGSLAAPASVLRERFARAAAAVVAHYAQEDPVLPTIHPTLGAKLLRQHDEARELAAAVPVLEQELRYLAQRFLAVARHNIIEEERDLFPLAGR